MNTPGLCLYNSEGVFNFNEDGLKIKRKLQFPSINLQITQFNEKRIIGTCDFYQPHFTTQIEAPQKIIDIPSSINEQLTILLKEYEDYEKAKQKWEYAQHKFNTGSASEWIDSYLLPNYSINNKNDTENIQYLIDVMNVEFNIVSYEVVPINTIAKSIIFYFGEPYPTIDEVSNTFNISDAPNMFCLIAVKYSTNRKISQVTFEKKIDYETESVKEWKKLVDLKKKYNDAKDFSIYKNIKIIKTDDNNKEYIEEISKFIDRN